MYWIRPGNSQKSDGSITIKVFSQSCESNLRLSKWIVIGFENHALELLKRQYFQFLMAELTN